MIIEIKSSELEAAIRKIVEDAIIEKSKQEKEYLSYREAAELLDVKVETLTRHVNAGIYTKHFSKSGKPYLSRTEIMEGFE